MMLSSYGGINSCGLRQTHQLGRLIDAQFEPAKLESGTVAPKLEPFVIAEFLQDVALLSMDGALARGDIELIERVMSNLPENAPCYTPAGGTCASRCRWSRCSFASA